jgi:hypothetical protein
MLRLGITALAAHGSFAGPWQGTVRVRIIGRPHDLVRADIVGQDGESSLDRLDRRGGFITGSLQLRLA